MKLMCETFKIKHRNSTAYRPQMNGDVEAANKNIKKILKTMDEQLKLTNLTFRVMRQQPEDLAKELIDLREQLEAYQEVVVGDFTIQEGETKDSIILKKADGEGGGFDKSLFEKYLTIFFDENF